MHKSERLGTKLIIFGVLLAIVVVFILFVLPIVFTSSTDLRLGDAIFRAKIALNSKDRVKGLIGESELASDRALLMAYPTEGEWGISMNNMTIPIDIVWLDANKKVIFIVKNVSPDSSKSVTHFPKTSAKYVIELPAGTVDSKSIKVNGVAKFKLNTQDIK